MRWIVTALGLLTLVATITSGLLWVFEQPVAAAIIATGSGALWLLLIVVATVAITSWWTQKTMQAGAQLALRAQDINDRWDSHKMASLVNLMREGARIARTGSTDRAEPVPALALPAPNNGGWLPELVEFASPADEVETGASDEAGGPGQALGGVWTADEAVAS